MLDVLFYRYPDGSEKVCASVQSGDPSLRQELAEVDGMLYAEGFECRFFIREMESLPPPEPWWGDRVKRFLRGLA